MQIPNKDPSFTVEELNKAASKFIEAGAEYWQAAHKSGVSGAVIWLTCEKTGATAFFTRGEYKDIMLQNIENCSPTFSFGVLIDE